MASGETPELISQEAFQSDNKPEGTPSPKEAPDQSKSSAASGSKMKNYVHDALQHVDFAKAALPFTQISCIKKLISKGQSVCRLLFNSSPKGTGFLLFERYIMTSAHLFKDNIKLKRKSEYTVKVQFGYENATEQSKIKCHNIIEIIDRDTDLDYAVLKLDKAPDDKETVHPALLEHFGPKPGDGAACIIGHPNGDVKKMDLTYIIGMNDREQATIEQVKNKSVIPFITNDNIIMSEHVITYDTYMFGGASGSPMFDEEGRVVGMHCAGLLPKGQKDTIIEYARPIREIYEKFVENLRKNKKTELLERVKKIAKTNT